MRSDRMRRFSASLGGNPRSSKTLWLVVIMIVLSVVALGFDRAIVADQGRCI